MMQGGSVMGRGAAAPRFSCCPKNQNPGHPAGLGEFTSASQTT